MLGLGEFGQDEFASHSHSKLMWVFFLLATFLTQITFLNMLIAIMGDTYSRVTENKKRFALRERTGIYSDFSFFIKLKNGFQRAYLYVVTPSNEQTGEDWEGSISSIRNVIKSNHNELSSRIDSLGKTLATQQTQMSDTLTRLNNDT